MILIERDSNWLKKKGNIINWLTGKGKAVQFG